MVLTYRIVIAVLCFSGVLSVEELEDYHTREAIHHNCFEDEVHLTCGPGCPKSCHGLEHKIKCHKKDCVSSCFCKEGTIRAENGFCVPPNECELNACRDDEEYGECESSCPKTCENYDKHIPCADHCATGCFCKKGLVRTAEGACIPPEKCPKKLTCREDEVYRECSSHCAMTCENYKEGRLCPAVTECIPECECRNGLIRSHDGECVLPWMCDLKRCGEHEHHLKCGKCIKTCDNYDDEDRVCSEECREGCFCEDGYVRNEEKDTCVRPYNCPELTCGEHEEFEACGTCQRTCDDYDKAILCKTGCKRGCFCVDGYVRDDDGRCKKPAQCLKNQCKKNEEYNKCGSACPRNCENYKDEDNNKNICTAECVRGCFCKDGFIRQPSTGDCVEPWVCEAEKCSAEEEYKQCGSACPDTCENYKNGPRICTKQCVSGCFCKDGYVRAKDGSCITKRKCEESKCTSKEVYTDCGSECPPTCKNLDPELCQGNCVAGCFCKNGFVRDSDTGLCVSRRKCEAAMCTGNEQYYDCYRSCVKTCDNYTQPGNCNNCLRGCFCKLGFVRNDEGNCIRILQCPQNQCKQNEEYDKCGTCEVTCDNYNKDPVCTKECKKGCFCKKPLIRNANGQCVLRKQCPQNQCKPGEKYTDCGTCEKTCENYNQNIVCTQQCRDGCFCKHSLVRNAEGQCVPTSQCPQNQCKHHEEYTTCGTCEKTCENYNQPIVCAQYCREGCFCRSPYVRNSKGQCILQQYCPQNKCKPHEEYNACGSCEKTCDNYDKNDTCTEECREGCFCKKPFVRNDQGQCVFTQNCPQNQCRPDEEYSKCGTCDKTCDNYDKTVLCTQECKVGCFCKAGTVRNAQGACVPPKICPPRCRPNEIIYQCIPKCSNKCNYKPTDICTTECISGCSCKPGFAYNTSNICVPRQFCDVYHHPSCRADEIYWNCKPFCTNTCSFFRGKFCPAVCIPGCFCRPGFMVNEHGECVRPENCYNCPPKEKYFDCVPFIRSTCDNLNVPSAFVRGQCTPGCACTGGLVRNRQGDCVPPSECP